MSANPIRYALGLLQEDSENEQAWQDLERALEPGVPDLVGDRDPFHGAGREHQSARRRYHEDMRREIAPVIETGEPEYILRRCKDGGIQLALRNRLGTKGRS